MLYITQFDTLNAQTSDPFYPNRRDSEFS